MSPIMHGDNWLSWFDALKTSGDIRDAAYAPAQVLGSLDGFPLERAVDLVGDAMDEIYIPIPEHVQILQILWEQAKGHSYAVYPTILDYNRQISGEDQGHSKIYPIRCLTGLSGVGKSGLFKAFDRISRSLPDNRFNSEFQRIAVHPVRRIQVSAHETEQSILRGLANPLLIKTAPRMRGDELSAHVRKWLLASCTGSLLIDEMQFLTSGNTASTRTAQIILGMANLGLPLIYGANYSLVRKLMQRPHEERSRLLAFPIVLEPPEASSQAWSDVIAEYIAVSPQHFSQELIASAEEIHHLTHGLFRTLKHLLMNALRITFEKGKSLVSIQEVRDAYRSHHFTSHRQDVKHMGAIAISTLVADKRSDLVNPFTPLDQAPKREGLKHGSLTSLTTDVNPVSALLESSMNVRAQQTLKILRKAAESAENEDNKSKVSRRQKVTPLSAQSLQQGAQLLKNPSTTNFSKKR